jgi:hypothetical protein
MCKVEDIGAMPVDDRHLAMGDRRDRNARAISGSIDAVGGRIGGAESKKQQNQRNKLQWNVPGQCRTEGHLTGLPRPWRDQAWANIPATAHICEANLQAPEAKWGRAVDLIALRGPDVGRLIRHVSQNEKATWPQIRGNAACVSWHPPNPHFVSMNPQIISMASISHCQFFRHGFQQTQR